MKKNRRDAISGAFSAFRVSEWSVRRKVVAVLAIPVILAVVFGGLRVSSELTSASDYSTNQQRATVLGPAITYLAATERLALPSSLADRMGGDGTATPTRQYSDGATGLKQAAASANLTSDAEERRHEDDSRSATRCGTARAPASPPPARCSSAR